MRAIEVACDGGKEDLEYAPDVEWTIPDDWNACVLRVAGQRGTTFTLYQF